ncbi:MAG: DUF479 domain-containing protein [Methylococcales bacterium]|jgi:acyl carrier protein phosphodiesterase|nr:DUF479 domain-containing protein [Methylococcales bacterium]MBT7444337.1 DUF479 domain-containing protein [Methylococcales bacterium]
MNYLAHLYLSPPGLQQLGNFLGDFIKQQHAIEYPEALQYGLFCHQKIDGFTDKHITVMASKRRMSPANRRYAPVHIDIFYDHFLAVNWSTFTGMPLQQFVDNVYALFRQHAALLPEDINTRLDAMIEYNWLMAYEKAEGIEAAISRIAERAKGRIDVDYVMHDFHTQYAALEQDFLCFFPQLIGFVDALVETR